MGLNHARSLEDTCTSKMNSQAGQRGLVSEDMRDLAGLCRLCDLCAFEGESQLESHE